MEQKTRILIVDDSAAVRKDLRLLLELVGGVEVVGEAANQPEAVQQALEREPEIVLMDLEMGSPDSGRRPASMSGCAAIRAIKSLPAAPIVFVLTVHGYPEAEQAAFGAGADQFLIKGQDADILFSLIHGYRPQ